MSKYNLDSLHFAFLGNFSYEKKEDKESFLKDLEDIFGEGSKISVPVPAVSPDEIPRMFFVKKDKLDITFAVSRIDLKMKIENDDYNETIKSFFSFLDEQKKFKFIFNHVGFILSSRGVCDLDSDPNVIFDKFLIKSVENDELKKRNKDSQILLTKLNKEEIDLNDSKIFVNKVLTINSLVESTSKEEREVLISTDINTFPSSKVNINSAFLDSFLVDSIAWHKKIKELILKQDGEN